MLDAASKHSSSLIKKSIILLSIVFVFGNLYYSFHGTKLDFYSKLFSVSWSGSQECIHDKCRISLEESDGWFCESDEDWERRKHIHHIQDKRNRNTDAADVCLGYNWDPTVQCAFERRIGKVGDGGKWVCDIHRLRKNNLTSLIYSFGSDGEFSFERDVKQELPNAEIHTFDLGAFHCPFNICVFHQARLGAGNSNQTKSLQEIINELGHPQRRIDILKIDIEGGEYIFFEEFFNRSEVIKDGVNSKKNQAQVPFIRQILVEVHLGDAKDESCRRIHRLFELFRDNNYAIFHKEANVGDAKKYFEFALIRLNSTFFSGSL